MKKILALVLALCMVFALAACGESAAPAATEAPRSPSPPTEAPLQEETLPEAPNRGSGALSADDIDDNMTSEDGKYELAFVTDVGHEGQVLQPGHFRRR